MVGIFVTDEESEEGTTLRTGVCDETDFTGVTVSVFTDGFTATSVRRITFFASAIYVVAASTSWSRTLCCA